ncbi:DUF2946 domain-containing protein [Tatumella sp. TA1]|uniref:DUF2946 domain-containing protein n=1 Tax=Rosenbergiella collisarenosi TaxID=1544695 RepID=UPI0012FDF2A3|nr:DUF2946 domain-containing protein [Rosenbergiella collisarenosi]MBT0721991.1 DUF2946 domain-containing protein [Rosenbergiella collisarenosi]QGX92807.1 DUF2946 domain-containing protein [Tatumella sp. TA1]
MFLTPVKYRLAAVSAILSILLLFIAPLISLSLYLSHSQSLLTAAETHAQRMNNEEMPGMDMPHGMAMQKGDHTMSPESGMLCGYCELLVHFPFFAWIAAAVLWLITALSRFSPYLPYRTIVLLPCYPPRLSRGPPRVLS